MFLGAIIAGSRTGQNVQVPFVLQVVVGLAIGAIAGSLILLVHPKVQPKQPKSTSVDLFAQFSDHAVASQSSVLGRVLAILGILLCWTPTVGLLLNVIAWAVNGKSEDWTRVVSMVGLAISVVLTVAFACMLIIPLTPIWTRA